MRMSLEEAAKASLLLAEAILDEMLPLGQWPIFSTELTLWNGKEYYYNFTRILQQRGGFLYQEFFCSIKLPATCLAQVLTNIDSGSILIELYYYIRIILLLIVSRGIPVQVHAPLYNLSSTSEIDYQLAAFLLFAGEYSSFMSSPAGVWEPDSPIWHKQYDLKLGAPLNMATFINEMHVFPGLDNLFSEVKPGYNSSTVRLIGVFDSSLPCQRLCEKNSECLSFQWTTSSSSYDAWAGLCYHRFDYTWTPVLSSAAVSGLKFTKWKRSFENLEVEVDILATTAILDWH